MQTIEVCANDCIAYYNVKHMPRPGEPPYMHEHRTRCPVCGTSRTVRDPRDGKEKPRKVIYFWPLEHFIRGMFKRQEIVEAIRAGERRPPPGSIRLSRGWKEKMLDDPVMGADNRNIGLQLATDGVPYFKDQVTSPGVEHTLYVIIFNNNVIYLF